MAVQMIFCLETNKRANTDYIYIKETIDYLYEINNQIKLTPVYMGSKTKYQSRDVMRQIEQKTKDFTLGETKIIYCIDTDEYEKNREHEKTFQDIRRFCEVKHYELIWFCHDVEEVFLGRKVPDSLKVQEAGDFRKRKKIEEVTVGRLENNTIRVHTSNILNILDKYLSRK